MALEKTILPLTKHMVEIHFHPISNFKSYIFSFIFLAGKFQINFLSSLSVTPFLSNTTTTTIKLPLRPHVATAPPTSLNPHLRYTYPLHHHHLENTASTACRHCTTKTQKDHHRCHHQERSLSASTLINSTKDGGINGNLISCSLFFWICL